MTPYDVFMVGVGGQGVLTIGEIMAEAAFRRGIPVNFYPTKGMAQRGGFVKAQVRMGRRTVGPNIPEMGADLIVSTEVSETLKAVRYIRPGGEVVMIGLVWAPTEVVLGKAPYPGPDQVLSQIRGADGKAYYIEPGTIPCYENAPVPENIYLLGYALGHTHLGKVLNDTDVAEIVRNRWTKGAERNLFALEQGLKARR